MEKLPQATPNESYENGKIEQKSILDTNTQKSDAKKKFSNTVFATKMRNRKKEEKLKQIGTTEILTNCKAVSIDVTRMNSEAVPKLISTVEQKNRRKKRYNRWKLGLTAKKRKLSDRSNKMVKHNKELKDKISVDEINHVNTETKIIEKEEDKMIEDSNLKALLKKDIAQKRKCFRHRIIPPEVNSECVTSYIEPAFEENFSCRRTEPFIGKLKTKEDRILNIEKISKLGSGPVNQNNNETIENNNKDLSEDNDKQNKNESVSETNSNIQSCNSSENKKLDRYSHKKSLEKKENKSSTYINEHKNIKDVTENTEKNPVNQESKNSISEVIKTKENLDNEQISCRRTLPFAGVTIRKPPSVVQSTEIDCLADPNTNSNCMNETVMTKSSSSSLDINVKRNCNVNEESKISSKTVKTKPISASISNNIKIKSSKKTSTNETISELEVSKVQDNTKRDCSTSDTTISNSSKSTKLENSEKIQSLEVERSSSKVKETLTSSNKKETESNVLNKSVAKLNKSIEDVNLHSSKSQVTCDTNELWSCRRTVPYLGKIYPHCSRTLPYVRSSKKLQATDASGTNLHTNESSQNTSVIHIPENSERKSVDCAIDSTGNLDNSSEILVHNREWKFRRKREESNAEDVSQVEKEIHPSKKLKIMSSPVAESSAGQQSNTPHTSSEKTICSLFSLNCTKHTHHATQNGECKKKQDVYILLTRLEHMNDSLVIDYLKKTELSSRIESDSEKLDASSVEKVEQVAKDEPASLNASLTSDLNNSNAVIPDAIKARNEINRIIEAENNNTEQLVRPKSRARGRAVNRMSSESPSFPRVKRKKHPVNYIDDFSDSDDDKQSDFSIRTRSQSRGPILRERIKCTPGQESDEDYMEKKSSLSTSNKSRSQNRSVHEFNPSITDNKELNEPTSARTRPLSHAAKASESPKKVQYLNTSNPESSEKVTVDHSGLSTRLSLIQSEINQQYQMQDDAELDKEIEEHSRNYKRLRSQSRSSLSDCLKSPTPSLMNHSTELSGLQTPSSSVRSLSDQLFSTPKSNSTNNALVSGRISRASKNDEFSGTPRKVLTTPTRSIRSNTPKSIKCLANNLLTKLIQSQANSEIAETAVKRVSKNILIQDLKVQLIRLETICQNFKDYSASEIEVLTRKYIDLLMNSNFSCDTWHQTINYNRSRETSMQQRIVDQIDNSDCMSTDVETQREDSEVILAQKINEPVVAPTQELIVIEENIIIEEPKKTSPKKTKEATSKEIEEQKLSSSTLLESVISMNQTVESFNVEENEGKNQDEPDVTIENSLDNSKSNTISVNGTMMYTCPSCYKIFVIEDLLKEHITLVHSDASTVSNTATPTDTSKLSEKRATEAISDSSNLKKLSEKGKKRYRYSDSLKCTICSLMFETKELLFEHIITHTEQELQEAYKTAMAKSKDQDPTHITDDSDVDLNGHNKKKNKVNKNKSTDSSIISNASSIGDEEPNINDPTATLPRIPENTLNEHQQHQIVDLVNIDNGAGVEPIYDNICQRPMSICPCHAHETTNQDLQIEMVLLCKTCNVIFRRRDCFEVHYRSSPECRQRRTNKENTKIPKLFCSGCPCVLESLMKMREHLEEHAKKNRQGTVTFICNICKVAFFGVGGIFYSHWFNHTKAPNFVASKYSFPKLSVVSVLEDSNISMTTTKSQEGFFYIAEHVCRQCRVPFSSEPELQRHKEHPCQPPTQPRLEGPDSNRLQMIKLICDLCKKYYVNKENFDRHCCERNHLKTPTPKFSRLPLNSSDQAFMCSLCRAVTNSNEDMKEHWKRIHSPIMELYTCKTCNVVPSNDVTNYTYEKFEKHCRIIHKSEVITCLVYFVTARYVCNICKFGFETERSMKEHQVVHQKRSTVTNMVPAPAQPIVPMVNQPTPSFWFADHPNPDGSRQMHPVYVQYPNLNQNIHLQSPILTNIGSINMPDSQQMPSEDSPVIHAATLNVTPNIITDNNAALSTNVTSTLNNPNTAENSMLRSILGQPIIDPPQSSSPSSNAIEMIQIDSRSNSPMLDSTGSDGAFSAVTTRTETPATSANAIVTTPSASRKKSYMTMVNPDFETMLGTNSNHRNNDTSNNSPAPEKEISSSSGEVTPLSVESLTPQPFEVVLVTDDLSENSNSEVSVSKEHLVVADKTSDQNISNATTLQHKPQSPKKTESSTAKPFLRVRSIAELQKMRIHLCSVCGLSFDTLSAFEQHSQQHEVTNEFERTTPVQIISPMVSQTNKETLSEPQHIILSQMRQKLTMLAANEKSLPNSAESNVRLSSAMHRGQPQQHQQQNYSFASCNSTTVNNFFSPNHNSKANQQQQHNQQNIVRRSINSSTNKTDTYLSPRGLPPPYPGTSNIIAPSRPGAIQLPERNPMDGNSPTSKRPSGAATRIPQQVFVEFAEHHQSTVRNPFSCNQINDTIRNNSSVNRLQSNTSLRSHMPIHKTYSRHSNEVNYTNTVNNAFPNYNNPGQQQLQQQKNIYSCNVQGCSFRSDNLSLLRSHEKNHLISQKTTSTSPANQVIPSHSEHQIQRLPSKHVSVIQMPERTRHPIPNRIPPPNNSVKRLTCRICNFYCTTSMELIEHVTANHSSPASNQVCCYVCDYCPTPLIFDSEDLLRKHMNVSHNHFCTLCNKRYPSKEDLILHMDVHKRST